LDTANGRVVLMRVSDAQELFDRSAIVHEAGHTYNLSHCPELDGQGKIVGPCREEINGFRILQSGKWGYNKSIQEGNGEANTLNTLMFPKVIPSRMAFISNKNYKSLFLKFEEDVSNPRYFPLLFASSDLDQQVLLAQTQNKSQVSNIIVSGYLFTDEQLASIKTVSFSENSGSLADQTGEYELVQLNAEGKVLSRTAFAPLRLNRIPNSSSVSFLVSSPVEPELVTLQIMHKNQVLIEQSRSPETPVITNFSFDPLSLTLQWHVTDSDNDRLQNSLFYSPNKLDWLPLVSNLDTSSYLLKTKFLQPGSLPSLKLISSDGFNSSEVIIDVSFSSNFEIQSTIPSEGENLDMNDAVLVVFNSNLNPETLSDSSFKLFDKDGETVSAHLSYNAASQMAKLNPTQTLKPNSTYQVSISGLTDLYGNTLKTNYSWSFQTGDAPVTEPDFITGASIQAALDSVVEVILPEQCAGFEKAIYEAFLPSEDSIVVSVSEDNGCRLELQVAEDIANLRSTFERTALINRYRILQNSQDADGRVSLSFENKTHILDVELASLDAVTSLILHFKTP